MDIKKIGRQWYVRVAILISILAYAPLVPDKFVENDFTKKYCDSSTTPQYIERKMDTNIFYNISFRIAESIGVHFIQLILASIFFFCRYFKKYYPKWFLYLLFASLSFTWSIILTNPYF